MHVTDFAESRQRHGLPCFQPITPVTLQDEAGQATGPSLLIDENGR